MNSKSRGLPHSGRLRYLYEWPAVVGFSSPFLDLSRYTILPNTAGCFSADDAIRVARLGREILLGLENPGADWVKLEVLGDKKTLLPDPVATLEATGQLVKEGFQVLCLSLIHI